MAALNRPLGPKQETRLISFLDERFEYLQRHYQRRGVASDLPSIERYLAVCSSVQAIILSIPAAEPSASLRVQYSLRLLAAVPPAIAGYPDTSHSAALWSFLDSSDAGWVAILSGQDWDAKAGRPASQECGQASLRATDKVRLESLILEVKDELREKIGLPGDPRLPRLNPFADVVEPRFPHVPMTSEDASGEEATPALDTDMELDTVASETVTTPPSETTPMPSDDDDDSEEEMEEVTPDAGAADAPIELNLGTVDLSAEAAAAAQAEQQQRRREMEALLAHQEVGSSDEEDDEVETDDDETDEEQRAVFVQLIQRLGVLYEKTLKLLRAQDL